MLSPLRDFILTMLPSLVIGLLALLAFPWLYEFIKAYSNFVHSLFAP